MASARRGILISVLNVCVGDPPCINRSKIQGGPASCCMLDHCFVEKILLKRSACRARSCSRLFQSAMM